MHKRRQFPLYHFRSKSPEEPNLSALWHIPPHSCSVLKGFIILAICAAKHCSLTACKAPLHSEIVAIAKSSLNSSWIEYTEYHTKKKRNVWTESQIRWTMDNNLFAVITVSKFIERYMHKSWIKKKKPEYRQC